MRGCGSGTAAAAAMTVLSMCAHAAEMDPIVNTAAGAVRGRCGHGGGGGGNASAGPGGAWCVFYNIPFAKPPVGALRFAPPVPVGPSPRGSAPVHDGTRPGPACWQTPRDPVTPQSEDCLTVDVWAPPPLPPVRSRSSGRDRGGLPVIVFFYGGGALTGASSWYNFSAFAAARQAVVVAANYRVGPLGFLALRELSAESPTGASGNYGLMDCELAVRFAAANAAAFGGDPARVTVMGQSSGATAAWALVGRWWARGQRPFQRAVVLSGSPNITMGRARAERQNAPLAVSLGCAAADGSTPAKAVVACLRAAPASAVSYGHAPVNTTWQEYDALTWGLPGPAWRSGFPLPGVVIVDGSFLTEPLADALARAPPAGAAPLGLLVSNVGEEDDLVPNEDFSHNASAGPLERFLDARLAPWGEPGFGSGLLTRFGFGGLPPQRSYLQIASTMGDACGQLHLVRLAAASAPSAALHYIAVVDGPSNPQILGVLPGYVSRYAYHQMDLLWATQQWDFFADFAFGPGNHTPYAPTADDVAQSALLRGAYTAFASGESPRGIPAFGAPGAYTAGLVHKTSVLAEKGWRAPFCDEMQRVGLWQPFWWAN